MLIYLITNKVNGKKYIGQTAEGLERRWSKHTYNARKGCQTALGRAIRKYGTEAFGVIQIASCLDKESLDATERLCIIQHQSNNPKYGYNLTDGGDGVQGFHHDVVTKQKIGAASKQRVSSELMRQLARQRWDARKINATP